MRTRTYANRSMNMRNDHTGRRRRRGCTLTTLVQLLVLLVFVSGCDPLGLGGLTDQLNESTNKAITALDDAITKLGNANADWQLILQDLKNQIPDAENDIKNDITSIADHAIGAAGSQIKCIVDFIGTRVREGLIRIKAKVLGKTVPAVEPSFCEVNPAAVDAARVPNELNLLEIFGYNFDTTPPMQVFLRNGDQDVDVSRFLDRPTHYHMTLNLGANGVHLAPNSQRFVVKWNGDEISTIGVIQPTTPVCKTRPRPFTPGSITFTPPHTRGDKEFDGNGPKVDAHVTLTNFGTHVDAKIDMFAKETESDWTTAAGSMTKQIYQPDPGWKVQQIVGTARSDFQYTDSNGKDDTFPVGGDGPVSIFTFTGDGDGDDAGIHTKVVVTFNALRLVEIETTNCVSPFAVRSLVLQRKINPATLRRLQPDLDRLAPDVQRLLPRSAP